MSCYHPLAGVRVGQYESGRPKYNIVSMSDHALDDFSKQDVVQIPCGKCLGCRLDYARRWRDRLLMELMSSDVAWFATMTYDDDHVPKIEIDDGKFEIETLKKKDFQDFIKRLRDHYEEDHIRYYLTGEYGENTFRPHGHAIIFGLHLDDVIQKPGVKSINNEPILYSKKFEEIWSNGSCELGTVTPESISYVARYVTKKLKDGAKEELYSQGLEKEFALMSRKPAIGRIYFDMYPDTFKHGNAFYPAKNGPQKIMPDRYFRQLIDDEQKKAERYVAAKITRESKLKMTNLGYLDYLVAEENVKKDKTKILTRDKI